MGDLSRRSIEEIQPGDVVLASAEVTGQVAPKRVIRRIDQTVPETLDVVLSTDETVRTTPIQKFMTEFGPTCAKDLRPGMRLQTVSQMEVHVVQISDPLENALVHNLVIEEGNHYFTGTAGIPAVIKPPKDD
jgi:hypothetical protein